MLKTVGEFQLLEELGRGNMGVVYRARRSGVEGDVALKVMALAAQAVPGSLGRFERECGAASKLSHPNIVRVVAIGTTGSLPYMALELVEGRDLDDVLAEGGPLDPVDAAELGAQIARALAHAHGQRVLHRDLKPANVMLHPTRGALLTDFGLAKVFGSQAGPTLTRSSDLLGSPAYMAPEQAAMQHERVSERTDVYGLGATLYEMLTGRAPCWGSSLQEVLAAAVGTMPPPPSQVNPLVGSRLDAIVLTCLAKEPEARYESADAVARELEAFVADPSEPARRAGAGLLVALTGVASLVATLVLVLALKRGDPPQVAEPAPDVVANSSEVEPERKAPPHPPAKPPRSPLPEDDTELLSETIGEARRAELLKEAQVAAAQAPNHAPAHVDVARAHLALGRLEPARQAVQRALALDGRLAAAFRVRGWIELKTRPPRNAAARAAFDRALALNPNSWQALRDRGVTRFNLRDVDGALVDLRASIRLRPSAGAYSRLGVFLMLKGRYGKAERAFEAAIARAPNDGPSLQNLSQCAMLRRDWRAAQGYLKRFLALLPNDVVARRMHVQVLLELKDFERVLEATRVLARLEPNSIAPLRQRARALIGLSRAGAAHDVLTQALERAPRDAEALLLLALAQRDLQAWSRVIATCDRLLALKKPLPKRRLAQVRALRAKAVQRSN